MDGYKKIIKSKRIRDCILFALRIIPDKQMVKIQYRIKLKRKLDLKNPKRFTEKIQWYKLNVRTPEMVLASDKYAVRGYIKNKGLEHILVDQYGVYEKFDDIDFSILPDKFVMKLSNGSGTNCICRDKAKIDIEELRKDFKNYLLRVKSNAGREWPYTQSKSVIIIEKLLEDENHLNNAVNDYKIFCYNGKPEYVICISDRYSDQCNHLVYTTDWEKVMVASEGARIDEDAPRPDNLKEMLDIAKKLSEDFLFARIDLYSLEEKIYFGEITFFPWSGYMEFEPDEFDYILGENFKINLK